LRNRIIEFGGAVFITQQFHFNLCPINLLFGVFGLLACASRLIFLIIQKLYYVHCPQQCYKKIIVYKKREQNMTERQVLQYQIPLTSIHNPGPSRLHEEREKKKVKPFTRGRREKCSSQIIAKRGAGPRLVMRHSDYVPGQ